jgi:hypothetical protein
MSINLAIQEPEIGGPFAWAKVQNMKRKKECYHTSLTEMVKDKPWEGCKTPGGLSLMNTSDLKEIAATKI